MAHDYSVKDVKNYLHDGTIKKSMNLKQRKSFLKYAKSFQLIDGVLYYVAASNKLRVLLTDEEKKLVFRDVHDSNHVGLNNTRIKLKSAFYWLGMVSDITKWIKGCDKCQRMKKIKTCAPELKLKDYKKIGRKGSRMKHDWLGPAIITDFKPTGDVVSFNSRVWKSAVAMPNMKTYLQENIIFLASNIVKEHDYCLQITDQIHIKEKPYDNSTSSSSTELNIALMFDLES